MSSTPTQPDEKPPSIDNTTEPEPADDTYDESDFKGRLSDEYKILQDKIDKIGAFRFTIKGWSITAVIGASAAASGRGLSTICIISMGLVLMLIFFFLLEHEQVRYGRLFGWRAGRLEDAFRRISRGKGREVFESFPVPYTAHELVLDVHRLKTRVRSQQSAQAKRSSMSWADKWRSWRQAHIGFYLVLGVLAFIPLLPHYQTIGVHFKGLTDRLIHTLSRR